MSLSSIGYRPAFLHPGARHGRRHDGSITGRPPDARSHDARHQAGALEPRRGPRGARAPRQHAVAGRVPRGRGGAPPSDHRGRDDARRAQDGERRDRQGQEGRRRRRRGDRRHARPGRHHQGARAGARDRRVAHARHAPRHPQPRRSTTCRAGGEDDSVELRRVGEPRTSTSSPGTTSTSASPSTSSTWSAPPRPAARASPTSRATSCLLQFALVRFGLESSPPRASAR